MNMRRRVQRNRINVRKLLIHSKGRTSYVPKHQIYRQMWKMNKYDSDNWPSVPHAHSFSGKQKMDVWTGEVFDAQTHKHVGNARKKEIESLHKDKEFIAFAKDAIKYHHEHYPEHKFTIPQWFEVLLMKPQLYMEPSEDAIKSFCITVIYE